MDWFKIILQIMVEQYVVEGERSQALSYINTVIKVCSEACDQSYKYKFALPLQQVYQLYGLSERLELLNHSNKSIFAAIRDEINNAADKYHELMKLDKKNSEASKALVSETCNAIRPQIRKIVFTKSCKPKNPKVEKVGKLLVGLFKENHQKRNNREHFLLQTRLGVLSKLLYILAEKKPIINKKTTAPAQWSAHTFALFFYGLLIIYLKLDHRFEFNLENNVFYNDEIDKIAKKVAKDVNARQADETLLDIIGSTKFSLTKLGQFSQQLHPSILKKLIQEGKDDSVWGEEIKGEFLKPESQSTTKQDNKFFQRERGSTIVGRNNSKQGVPVSRNNSAPVPGFGLPRKRKRNRNCNNDAKDGTLQPK